MIDLSLRENRALFKKLQRLNAANNVLMCVISVVSAALAIWALSAQSGSRNPFDWAEILLLVLIGTVVVLGVLFLALQFKIRKPYNNLIYGAVAEAFKDKKLLNGDKVELELVLVGDKLTLFRQGTDEVVQLDLSPVKTYTSVCAALCDRMKKYVYSYYFINGAADVVLHDKINRKEKVYRVVENGKPLKNCKNGYFIKNGLIG